MALFHNQLGGGNSGLQFHQNVDTSASTSGETATGVQPVIIRIQRALSSRSLRRPATRRIFW